MKDKKIDILHQHRSGKRQPFAIEAAMKAHIPVIVETNVFGHYDDSKTGRSVDMHLLISKTIALKHIQNANISIKDFLKKCKVLYYPVDIGKFEKYKPSKKRIKMFKSKIGIEENTPLIGRIGRPDMAKWDKFSVDMMAHLIKKLPEVRYLIVGGIPEPIKRKIKKLMLEKNFIDIGSQLEKNLIAAYYSIDVLAHSSFIGESFGYTIAEAMAARKPVVVNSTPWADNAQIELVDNGVTGFIANTPKTYAQAVEFLLTNTEVARRMGEAGYEKTKRLFDANRIVRMLEGVYIKTLSSKGYTLDRHLLKMLNVESFPSDAEIIDYPQEYKRRLFSCFSKPLRREKILCELRYYWTLRYYKRKAERMRDRVLRRLHVSQN